MIITNEQEWNNILDKTTTLINPLHTYNFYQYWNNGGTKYPHDDAQIWTNLYGKRYLWADGNYAWSFIIKNTIAIGSPRLWLLPLLSLKGGDIDTSDIKEKFHVGKISWVSNEIDDTTYPFECTKISHSPRCTVEVIEPEEYYMNLPKKSRYEIRKARRHGYVFEEINPRHAMDAIMDIHKSDKHRQGKPLPNGTFDKRAWTRTFDLYSKYLNMRLYGITKNGAIYAYMHPTLGKDIAFFQEYMTHKDHYSNGIGNLLFYETYREMYDMRIKYILGAYAPRRPDIQRFHLHMGWFLSKQWINELVI